MADLEINVVADPAMPPDAMELRSGAQVVRMQLGPPRLSTLAALRDLAGCRAVLQDALLECAELGADASGEALGADPTPALVRARERVLAVHRVVLEAEAALWDGGECGAPRCSSSRRAPRPTFRRRPGGPPIRMHTEAWRETAMAVMARDWLAWNNYTLAAAGRSWTRRGPFDYGLPDVSGLLRERYDQHAEPGEVRGLADWIQNGPRKPAPVYMSPANYERLRARINGTGVVRTHHHLVSQARDRSHQVAAALHAHQHLYGRPADEVTIDEVAQAARDLGARDLRTWATGPLVPTPRFKPEPPAEDGVEIRARAWCNLITALPPGHPGPGGDIT